MTISQKKRKEVGQYILLHPRKSGEDVGKVMKLAKSTVLQIMREQDLYYDEKFVEATAGTFIKEFMAAADYWRLQIETLEQKKIDLETLKSEEKTIFLTNKETGGSFEKTVMLSPMEILAITREQNAIEKQQTDLKSKITEQAEQGKVRQIIKMMRNGELSKHLN